LAQLIIFLFTPLYRLNRKKADISNEEIQQVIQLVKETRALDLTRELKEKFVKKALSALDNLSDSDYKNICIDLVKLL